MNKQAGTWSDQRIQAFMGDLLRAGVVSSAAIVLIGGLVYLIQQGNTAPDYAVFHREPAEFRSVTGIVSAALSRDGGGIIQLGILLLIATPVATVVFSVFAFSIQRDWLYTFVTLIVFAVLVFRLSAYGSQSKCLL